MSRAKKRCSLGFCKEPHYAKGLCRTHHARLLRTGDPLPNRTRGICKVEDCWADVKGRGYCTKHVQRVMKHGDPHHAGPTAPPCSVEGCSESNWSYGFCKRHYAKWRRHGDPLWEHDPKCRMDQCHRRQHGHGLCTKHYFRWRKWGDPWFDGIHYPECKVEGCYRPKAAKGYCGAHSARLKKYGHPLGGPEGYNAPMRIDLPYAPIAKVLSDRGGFAALMERLGPDYEIGTLDRERVEKYLDRSAQRGTIDLAQADHFAVKILGTHPALLWGGDYWTAEAEPEPEVAYEFEQPEQAAA